MMVKRNSGYGKPGASSIEPDNTGGTLSITGCGPQIMRTISLLIRITANVASTWLR
jgi:hypothetical protein